MTPSPTVNYSSFADKAKRYPRQTLALVIEQAQQANFRDRQLRVLSSWLVRNGLPAGREGADRRRLAALHDAARGGLYVEEQGPRDEIRAVEHTLRDGGDCEDWAAVLLAALQLWGVPAQICTAGDELDNFRHVFVRAHAGSKWCYLDPRGSIEGAPFDVNSAAAMPVQRLWQWDYDLANDHLMIAEVIA